MSSASAPSAATMAFPPCGRLPGRRRPAASRRPRSYRRTIKVMFFRSRYAAWPGVLRGPPCFGARARRPALDPGPWQWRTPAAGRPPPRQDQRDHDDRADLEEPGPSRGRRGPRFMGWPTAFRETSCEGGPLLAFGRRSRARQTTPRARRAESCQEGGPPRFKRDAVAGDRLKSKFRETQG